MGPLMQMDQSLERLTLAPGSALDWAWTLSRASSPAQSCECYGASSAGGLHGLRPQAERAAWPWGSRSPQHSCPAVLGYPGYCRVPPPVPPAETSQFCQRLIQLRNQTLCKCATIIYLPHRCPDAVTVAVQLLPDVSLLVAVQVERRARQALRSGVVLHIAELLILQNLVCVFPLQVAGDQGGIGHTGTTKGRNINLCSRGLKGSRCMISTISFHQSTYPKCTGVRRV